jgi:hypothetical protein
MEEINGVEHSESDIKRYEAHKLKTLKDDLEAFNTMSNAQCSSSQFEPLVSPQCDYDKDIGYWKLVAKELAFMVKDLTDGKPNDLSLDQIHLVENILDKLGVSG